MHNAAKNSCDVVKQKSKSQNKNKWWTSDCSAARKRSRLFFHNWKSAGHPSQGIVFQCYKEARKSYRKGCRTAVQNVVNNNTTNVKNMHLHRDSSLKSCQSCILRSVLENFGMP